MGKVIFGGIIGAIIAFVWSFISWSVLPWHEHGMNHFKNEEFVTWVLKENTKKDGVYVTRHLDSEQAFESKGKAAPGKKGPFVYTQIKRKGIDMANPRLYIVSFLTKFVGAALICYLLMQAKDLRYGGRLFFVTLIGLIVGVLGEIPNWNWFAGGTTFTLVMMADLVITWFLAGLVLAAFVKPSKGHERAM